MGTPLNHSPGRLVRQLRERLGFNLREVEQASSAIASYLSNPEFSISIGRLSDIETKDAVPNIYKLFSLSLIYRIDLLKLFSWYGMDVKEAHKIPVPKPKVTHITDVLAASGKSQIPIFDPGFTLEKTSNVGRLVQEWGHVPLVAIEQFVERKFTFGYIGEDDYTMYPLLPPGSFIQVDEGQRKVLRGTWANEYERPIYFVETRAGYFCCWCSLPRPNQIVLEAHPLSHVQPRVFLHPQEAEVLGRVVGVAMRLELRQKREALQQSTKSL
jgi:transcriptional regulator with XRE-family HTH domain